mgnify:FL=1
MGGSPITKRALDVVRAKGIARTRDFERVGVPRAYLSRLQDEGLLVRTARGRYELPGAAMSRFHALATAVRAVPRGTIAASSSLHFHGLLPEVPDRIWMLVPAKAWKPVGIMPDIEILRESEETFADYISNHQIDGVNVPLTNLGKTLCDCFKYRRRIGLALAVDALRVAFERKLITKAELMPVAIRTRVRTVMAPYLETIS